jgi:hypothetical protein
VTKKQYARYREAAAQFREIVARLAATPGLAAAQAEIARTVHGGDYTVQRPAVYNEALDEVTEGDSVRMILVGDNPGRREQENGRYLVGPSGKIAARFFEQNPALGIDFRKNVIILNKTPAHTCRTNELKILYKNPAIARAIEESQAAMAALLAMFHAALNVPVWIVGYSEMRRGGIFERYTRDISALPFFDSDVYVYRHFSMNQFTIELNKERASDESVVDALMRIGTKHRLAMEKEINREPREPRERSLR